MVSHGLALAGPLPPALLCPGAVGKVGIVQRMTWPSQLAHGLGSPPGGAVPVRQSHTDLDIWLQEVSCSSFQGSPREVGVGRRRGA